MSWDRLVDGLRTPEYADSLVIPPRYITRPARASDDTVENKRVTHDMFETGVSNGSIWPFWNRTLDADRVEQYGFDRVGDDRLPVYSANNAFLRDRNGSVEAVLSTGLVVFITASETMREERLGERSPDMSPAERLVRLRDAGQDILHAGVDVEAIDTSELSNSAGQLALQSLVNRVLETRAQTYNNYSYE